MQGSWLKYLVVVMDAFSIDKHVHGRKPEVADDLSQS